MSVINFTIRLFFLSTIISINAQEIVSKPEGDLKYREDQLYLGITYNLVSQVPRGVNLRGVSGGINFGYLRDMPINKRRNLAFAIGAGISFDRYGQTLFIGEDEEGTSIFRVLTSDFDFDRNRFSTYTLELPLEFRWRSSTPTEYKFWRLYGGIRAGYTFRYRSFFRQTGNEVSQTDISEFDPLRLAATLSFGYGSTLNLHVSYGFNPFFDGAVTGDTGETINFRPIKLGIIFYLL